MITETKNKFLRYLNPNYLQVKEVNDDPGRDNKYLAGTDVCLSHKSKKKKKKQRTAFKPITVSCLLTEYYK